MTIIHDPVQDLMRNFQIIQSIQNYQDEQERMEIARQNLQIKQQDLAEKREYQANNDLLEGLWKAVTDKGTPPEVAEHLRTMADNYGRTMAPQQRQMLDITITRGLYSDVDRKTDVFKRIKGERPQGNFENLKEEEMIPKMSEVAVGQVEWDYAYKSFLVGGKDKLPEDSVPKLIPVTQFTGKDGVKHNVFARKDPNTGLIQTIDTGSDIDTSTYAKALEKNWSPNLMAQHDFIPGPESSERIVRANGKVYSTRSGYSLTDGSLKILKTEIGTDSSGSGGTKTTTPLPANVFKTLNTLNSYALGDVEEKDLGLYSSIAKTFKSLGDIELDPRKPQEYEAFKYKLLQAQDIFAKNNPGYTIAPYGAEKSGGIIDYEFEEGKYFAFPADVKSQLVINGKPTTFWYANKVQGQEGEHVWHDIWGNHLKQLDGFAPGSDVENSELGEADAVKQQEAIKQAKERFASIPEKKKTIKLRDWLSREFAPRTDEEKMNQLNRYISQRGKDFPTEGFKDLSALTEALVRLPGKILEKIGNIDIEEEE